MSIESKSILAKLMAQENLHIEQRKVSTASFNTKTRVLTVPILNNDIKPWTYDLFMGHEVGHALWTTVDDLTKATDLKLNKAICNIVEDSRIERKIKDKYPGLKNSFSRAYKELYAENFFGTVGIDVNKMNFIDRINLYCKVGVSTGIKFDEEETELLKEVESTQTFDDVIEVVKKIKSFMEEQEEKRKQKNQSMKEKGEIDEDSLEEIEFDEDMEGLDEDFSEIDEPSNEPLTDDEDGTGYGGGEKIKPEITSHTEQQYRENEKKLFAENAKERAYANIPKVDIKKVIMDYKELYKLWSESTESSYIDSIKTEDFIRIRNSSSKAVSYLVKEFEMRKNADQLKRASVAKTGELNMNKIFSYKFNEDIFKKVTVLPGGKSHGLVMFLDWSGSMSMHIENTVKQLISLVLFCKKVNIPYEVYAFNMPDTDFGFAKPQNFSYKHVSNDGELELSGFRLLNLLSSRMSAAEFTKCASILVSYIGKPFRTWRPRFMDMSGTPLNEAIISAMEIVPAFQRQYKLQVVNTVFLTDGEGHSLRNIVRIDEQGIRTSEHINYYRSNLDLVIVDPVTRNQEKISDIHSMDSHTKTYLNLFKKRTNCNVVGFYVLFGREYSRCLERWYTGVSPSAKDAMKAEFRKNKYSIVTNSGYDEYYVLRSEALDTEEEDEFTVRENATTRGLVSAFTKYAGGRVQSRTVLNKFIGMIA